MKEWNKYAKTIFNCREQMNSAMHFDSNFPKLCPTQLQWQHGLDFQKSKRKLRLPYSWIIAQCCRQPNYKFIRKLEYQDWMNESFSKLNADWSIKFRKIWKKLSTNKLIVTKPTNHVIQLWISEGSAVKRPFEPPYVRCANIDCNKKPDFNCTMMLKLNH